jgi:hypothetical protein
VETRDIRVAYFEARVLAAGLLGGVQYPQDVEDHDEGWHYQAGEHNVLLDEGVVQPEEASDDDQSDGHVPTGAPAFLLQQWDASRQSRHLS